MSYTQHELVVNLYELKSRISVWEDWNHFWANLYGIMDLTFFHLISPKHSRNNDKQSVSRNFDIWNICPMVVNLHYQPWWNNKLTEFV